MGSPRERPPELVSVVAPVCDELGTLAAFHERLRAALGDVAFEVVFVDDGSTDGSAEALDRLADADPAVRVIHLSRNFGHQTALTAGLDHARGDVVVMLDADLQDPPELIPAMLGHWRDGSDVVYAVRRARAGETRVKLATARWFYALLGRVANIEIPAEAGDFRLIDRSALDALLTMRERNRFLRGMTVWVGFTQTAVPYERDARHGGATKYTFRRMVRFGFDALTSFSHTPLQAATLLGFFFSAVAFLCIPLTIAARYADIFARGIPSTIVIVLLLGGIQLITVGIIGEYVARIYDEVKRRPLYVVRDRRGIPADEPVPGAERERISTW
jgi:polyisoprenyl-phosphate glycosyltransferase